ncbi:MAG: sulfatase [Polyangia bacterium]
MISRLASALSSLFALAACCACGNGGQAPEPAGQKEHGGAASAAEQNHRVEQVRRDARITSREREESEVDAAFEPLYDLAENLDQAHIRSGGILVDFGAPSRHKHTLGDWKTGWRGDYEKDGTTFSYAAAAAVRVLVEAEVDEEGGGRIEIRGRAVGGRSCRVYLNDRFLGEVELPRDGFGHGSVSFDKGLAPGRNEVLLRFSSRRPADDGSAASAAIDYLRIVPSGTDSSPAASSSRALEYPDPAGREPGIALAAGESLTWFLPLPQGAVLRGEVRPRGAAGGGKLSVRARGDDGEARELRQISVGKGGRRLGIGLDDFAGAAVGLTLEAAAGELVLSEARISVPESRDARVAAPGRMRARNLVIVLIDTLRADHLALYNPQTRVRTDYLDELAGQSLVFDRALAQENWTKPSVATLLTGLYPETHRTKNEKHRLPATVEICSEHFEKLEFATAGFVANGYISGKFGFERGWDAWTNYVREGKPNRAQHVVDDAVAWLESRPEDRPFFLYVHTIDPHVPYIPPGRYRSLYDPNPYRGPVRPAQTAKLLEKVKKGTVGLSERDRFRLEALYDGEITYHDDQLARLHEALEEQGLLDDTLLVVTSDHGEEFFEHGSVGHGHSVYEELLHVPLILRLPGAEPREEPLRCAAEVGLVDVLPTACELLGVDCPAGVEGRSLVPLLGGEERLGWPDVQFSDFMDGQRVARCGRYKLVYRGLATTLFDLEKDPRETTDIGDRLPVTFAALHDLLGRHQGGFVPRGTLGREQAEQKSGRTRGEKPGRKHRAEKIDIDPETREQLEELGYVGD